MKSRDWLHSFGIFSKQGGKPKPASKSEVFNWLKSGAVLVNGEGLQENEEMDFPIFSCVVFPKGKRITLL